MLGLMVKLLDLENIDWKSKVKSFLSEKVHEVNIKAFEKGLNL